MFFEGGSSYRNCSFCRGKGCLACAAQADRDYKRQFPDGPKPLASFKTDDPADMAKARELIGADALRKHFSEGGEGMAGLIEALRAAGKLEER